MSAPYGQALLAPLLCTMSPRGPAWLRALRSQAAQSLRARGLPTRRDEAWRHTSLVGLADRAFTLAPGAHDLLAAAQPGMDVAVVGAEHADPALEALAAAHLGQVGRPEPFAALNLALFERGLVIRVRPGATLERPIHIVSPSVPGSEATLTCPRVLIVAGPGSAFTLVESFGAHAGAVTHAGATPAPRLSSAVTELVLEEGARVDHVRAHHGEPGAHLVSSVAVQQQASSRYHSHVVTLGGALCRLDLEVALQGKGASCRLHGVYHASTGEHVDHHTVIRHATPDATSHESYRGVIDGAGHAVFDGTIAVERHAQRTSAHQENRNLLLSDSAVVNTLPHLQIDADDVTCSHAATVGALDDDELFYLRSRGVDERHARAILTRAFVSELLGAIPHPPLAARLSRAVVARLPHGDMLGESDV